MKTYRHLYTVTFTFTVVSGPTGACIANKHYIEQLEETFATSVPSQIAAFFGEPIQLYSFYPWLWLDLFLTPCDSSGQTTFILLNIFVMLPLRVFSA